MWALAQQANRSTKLLRFNQSGKPPPPGGRVSWLGCLGTIAAVIGGFLFMGGLAIGLAWLLGLFDAAADPVQALLVLTYYDV